MDITNFALTQTIAVAVIVGLERVAKKLKLKNRYLPLLDVGIGIIIGILFFSMQGIQYGIMIGIILGLEACGLFGGIKDCVDCVKRRKNKDGKDG